MSPYFPTRNDLKTHEDLERVMKRVFNHLYDLTAAVKRNKQVDTKEAARIVDHAVKVTQNALGAKGANPLNVEGLVGQLAQPQRAAIPTVTELPQVSSYLAQPDAVVRYNSQLYIFDTTTTPGKWVAL